MQTPKRRTRALEVPQKSPSLVAARGSRHAKAKTPGSDSDSVSPQSTSKTPKERSPKIIEHKSPRSLVPLEKKRLGRISELESQVAQLQDNLKNSMEQLSSLNASKRQALADAEETRKQLMEISGAEEDRVQELREISHDRDIAWQSELEAVQRQHMMDTSSLASALNDIQHLQAQLEMVAGSERSARAEIHDLKEELGVCKESEARVLGRLESAKEKEELLRSDVFKTMEAYDSVSAELERSRALVDSLERKQQPDEHESELDLVKAEVEELRAALEESEAKCQEEYIKNTLQIRCAYEQIECAKSESCLNKAEWKEELNQARTEIEELRAKLMDKETELQGIWEENEELNLKIQKTASPTEPEPDLVEDMKRKLMDKEMKLQITMEENETLKKMNTNGNQKREARVMEQLDVAQAMNSHLETELRRLKVQSDQWRKAAEAAATMLSPDYNGRFNGSNTRGMDRRMNSVVSDDDSDDESKKSNGKMLKKFGVLWKKGHHQK